MEKSLIVSVIVVAHNEEKNITKCLDSLAKQVVKPQEIIIIDGNSVDLTSTICKKYAEKYDNVKYIRSDDSEQTIAKNRNIGLKNAIGDYVAFTDADCEVPVDWLRILIQGIIKYQAQGVVAVGGANIPMPNSNYVTKAVGIVQSSLLGFIGSAQGTKFNKDRVVNSLSCTNVIYKKEAILRIGGFNEIVGNIGEDFELSYRIRKTGKNMMYLSDSFVFHQLRNTHRSFAMNMFAYGSGRIKLIYLTKEFSIKYILPIIFIIAMSFSLIGLYFSALFMIIPISYLLIVTIYSILLSKNNFRLFKNIILSFLILHFYYSLGELYGLFKHL